VSYLRWSRPRKQTRSTPLDSLGSETTPVQAQSSSTPSSNNLPAPLTASNHLGQQCSLSTSFSPPQIRHHVQSDTQAEYFDPPPPPLPPALTPTPPPTTSSDRDCSTMRTESPKDAPAVQWKNGAQTVLPFITANHGANITVVSNSHNSSSPGRQDNPSAPKPHQPFVQIPLPTDPADTTSLQLAQIRQILKLHTQLDLNPMLCPY
jgi:hypothetical protein